MERPPPVQRSSGAAAGWIYDMRREVQEVVPGVYLGPYYAASRSKLAELQALGITHIVCVRNDMEAHLIKPHFPDDIKYLVLNIRDTVTENIIQYFPKVRKFVDESIAANGKTLVHGNAGCSRSAALVLAYVMEKYGLTISEAFAKVQRHRFCIRPNEGFMAQLSEYEPIYKAQRTLRNGQCSTDKWRAKRRIDEVEEQSAEPVHLSQRMDVNS
ncbi:serine/threonine/tyrosine-interacting protein-like isoform X2 [Bacillus rossius redtenbacheri]